MKIPAFNDPYSLLACFLSPWKDAEAVEALARSMHQAKADWGRLLYMANLHVCSPLWFVRLRKDRLLPLLPPDLQTYLLHLHQQNVERNRAIQDDIKEILSEFRDHDVPAILLKGAATLVDDLYRDPGARMMADIDLLIKPQHIHLVQTLMVQLGYNQQPVTGSIRLFDSYSPHHLPPYTKTGRPGAVEIHFEVGRGQAGRVLQVKSCWKNSETAAWEGLTASVLNPTYRMLHNTAHALVPGRNYVNSLVHLAHLIEFAYLARRYDPTVDWLQWLEMGTRQSLRREFRIYLTLANRLMGMPFPKHMAQIAGAGMHTARISVKANVTANVSRFGWKNQSQSMIDRVRGLAVMALVTIYRHLNIPAWEWRNRFYREGLTNIPRRFICLTAFLSWFYFRKFLKYAVLGLRWVE